MFFTALFARFHNSSLMKKSWKAFVIYLLAVTIWYLERKPTCGLVGIVTDLRSRRTERRKFEFWLKPGLLSSH